MYTYPKILYRESHNTTNIRCVQHRDVLSIGLQQTRLPRSQSVDLYCKIYVQQPKINISFSKERGKLFIFIHDSDYT